VGGSEGAPPTRAPSGAHKIPQVAPPKPARPCKPTRWTWCATSAIA